MDSTFFYEDTDTGSPRDIGPFDLAADLQLFGDTPALVLLSPLDAQYLLTLIEYLKEKEVWQPNADWQTIVNYVENLEVKLRAPVSWRDLFLPFFGENTVNLFITLPYIGGHLKVSILPNGEFNITYEE